MVTSIHSMETLKKMEVLRRFKGRKRGKSSMIGYDEVDTLKLNNDEVDKKKRLGKKKRTSVQKKKLIDTPFAKYISSDNIYILTLCCQ